MTSAKGPPWWRPFARRRWQRALELPADLARQLALQVAEDAAVLGLRVAGDCSAADIGLPGGWIVPRTTLERCLDPEVAAIRAGAARMLEEIARQHGTGRVWTLPGLEIVHPVYDDGMLVRLDRRSRPVVVLRAVYFHERSAVRPPPPRPIELEPWTR